MSIGGSRPQEAPLAIRVADGDTAHRRGELFPRRQVLTRSRRRWRSFAICNLALVRLSLLYVLQGGLAQQQWRVSELLHRLLTYLEPKLAQVYKNVRERIGR